MPRLPYIVLIVFLVSTASAAESRRSLNDLTGPWQLLVDDFVIAAKENVKRTYHAFDKHPSNPLVKADRPWEGNNVYVYGTVLPTEAGDGFRMWYHALPEVKGEDYYRLLYATSKDGLTWEKPNLGIVEYKGSKDNNIFIRRGKRDHILSIIHTPWENDSQRQYLMVNFDGDNPAGSGYMAAWSPDGIRWRNAAEKAVFNKGGDVGQFLRDFHTGQYLGYVKNGAKVSGLARRAVGYIATQDPVRWPDPKLIIAPDTFDDRWAKGIQRTSFYGLSAFTYQTMYLGFLWVFPATDHEEGYFDGPFFCELVTSRDGVHWLRQEGDRPPILDVGPKNSWDDGMVTTATQPLIVGDQLWLYYGGINGTHMPAKDEPWRSGIGLATLRKDGFASLDAGEKTGTITTKRLANTKGPLRLNCAAKSGSIRIEVLDESGKAIPGYTREECNPVSGDSLDAAVSWKTRKELPPNTTIRLQFVLDNASLYSFMAGEKVRVIEEPAKPPLAVLLTFEEGWKDTLSSDGTQKTTPHPVMRITQEQGEVAFGQSAARISSPYSPLQTIEMDGTKNLGTQFTLALMARTNEKRHTRLMSSYDDLGPIKTTELVFDCDPRGKCVNGLRLICKGIETESKLIQFDDGKYHHLAVTYDDGEIAFYLDGEPAGTGRVPGGEPVAMERNLRFGEDYQHANEQQFRGQVDDVLVFGRALGPAQIKTLATRGAEAFFKANPIIANPAHAKAKPRGRTQ